MIYQRKGTSCFYEKRMECKLISFAMKPLTRCLLFNTSAIWFHWLWILLGHAYGVKEYNRVYVPKLHLAWHKGFLNDFAQLFKKLSYLEKNEFVLPTESFAYTRLFFQFKYTIHLQTFMNTSKTKKVCSKLEYSYKSNMYV